MCYYEKDNEILYLLEKQKGDGVYGNKLNITLNGNNILNEGSEKWIINLDNFKSENYDSNLINAINLLKNNLSIVGNQKKHINLQKRKFIKIFDELT